MLQMPLKPASRIESKTVLGIDRDVQLIPLHLEAFLACGSIVF